jgi:hypothetical protein
VKRYRILCFDFDSRPNILMEAIQDHWEESVKALHRKNKQTVLAGLAADFGQAHFEQKIEDFVAMGPKPFSIVAYHNKFFEHARRAFVVGSYYPALTATCALGERILNHLMLLLREDFRATPEYKHVYRKDSFDNWDLPINTLSSWGVLLPTAAEPFRELAQLRNRHAIHFNPDTEMNDRLLALEAIRLMTVIITSQFSSGGLQPWFLGNIPGEIYIKKGAETQPFVKRVYLPNCLQLGPYHNIEDIKPDGRMNVRDDYPYEDRETTDEEFGEMRRSHRPGVTAPSRTSSAGA